MTYRFVWLLCRIVFGLFFSYRVVGAHHIPKEGAVILASNHVSNMDPPVVGVGFWRPGSYMAKEELFAKPLWAWFIAKIGAFPVKRGAGDRAALKKALELLAEGRALVMFPEGTRSETGELQAPEMGVAMIAYRSGAPVVPVYVSGTNQVMPRTGGIRRAPVSVMYGEPLRFAKTDEGRPGREEYEAAAQAIMAAIAALRDGRTPSAAP